MCRSRLWLLYWVSTHILRILALARLDSAKSMSRYSPPKGTAGLARSSVSGASRVPAPPASTIPRIRGSAIPHLPTRRDGRGTDDLSFPRTVGRGVRSAADRYCELDHILQAGEPIR